MACSKAHRFGPAEYYFSLLHRALSHPVRILIIEKLFQYKECSAKELRKGVSLSQNAVSQHFKILRESQLVLMREEYPLTFYRLNRDLPRTCAILEQLLKVLRRNSSDAGIPGELERIARVRRINIGESRLGESDYI